jgi:hypothetical protein
MDSIDYNTIYYKFIYCKNDVNDNTNNNNNTNTNAKKIDYKNDKNNCIKWVYKEIYI